MINYKFLILLKILTANEEQTKQIYYLCKGMELDTFYLQEECFTYVESIFSILSKDNIINDVLSLKMILKCLNLIVEVQSNKNDKGCMMYSIINMMATLDKQSLNRIYNLTQHLYKR